MGTVRVKAIPQARTSDIFSSELIPLFIICRCIGLFSYNKSRKISIFYIVISLFVHILFSCLVVYLLYDAGWFMYNFGAPFPDVQITTYGLSHGLNLVLVLCHLLIMLVKRNSFQAILDMLTLIDTLWESHSTLYSKKCTKLGMVLVILFYLLIPLLIGDVVDKKIIFYVVAFSFTEVCFLYIVMQFCSILEIIRKHLEELREDLHDDEMYLVTSISKHQTLMRFCPIVNDAYSWQILIMCFKFFVFSLMVAYLVILDSKALMPNAIRLAVLMWEFAMLFPIARTCSEIEEEADSFNNKLFNLMRESKDLCSNDKLHLYVTMKQSVNFTACGFFTLGYPLVTSIIAAATTYLVILVQFSMA